MGFIKTMVVAGLIAGGLDVSLSQNAFAQTPFSTPSPAKSLSIRDLRTIDGALTPIELSAPRSVRKEKKNALIMLMKGYGDFVMGYDEQKQSFKENVRRVQKEFNTYVALVDFPADFIEAHKLAAKKLGKLDFVYIDGHGSSEHMMLSETYALHADQLVAQGLAGFYSKYSRGVINACLTADTVCDGNFAQAFADAAGIPVEGATASISAYLAPDLHLEEPWTKRRGFSLQGYGKFESANGRDYTIAQTGNDSYKVVGMSSVPGETRASFELPFDFNSAQVWHYDTTVPSRAAFRELKPR